MQLTVNGKETQLAREMSLAEFLHSRGIVSAMVAVEHNLRWTHREDWPVTLLKENDRIEIIQMMAGG